MANNAKISQVKEKDFDDVVPREGFCDMPEELQEVVVGAAREACKKHHDGELKYYKTMAIYVKEQLDKKLGGSYHICVGKLQLFRNPLLSLHPLFITDINTTSWFRNKLWQLCDILDANDLLILARAHRFPHLEARMNDDQQMA